MLEISTHKFLVWLPFRYCLGFRQAPGIRKSFFLRGVFVDEIRGDGAQQRSEIFGGYNWALNAADPGGRECPHTSSLRESAFALNGAFGDPLRQFRSAEPYRCCRKINRAWNDADNAT